MQQFVCWQFFAAASERDPEHVPLLKSWARMEAAAAGNRADSDGSGRSADPSSPARGNGRAAQPSLLDPLLLQVQILLCCSLAVATFTTACSRMPQEHRWTPCSPACGSVPEAPRLMLRLPR